MVLAIGVFAIGVELPKAYMARHCRSIFFLLVPVMSWVCPFFVTIDDPVLIAFRAGSFQRD